MRAVAIIVHWGAAAPTVELAEHLEALPEPTEILVVANDRAPRPDGLPAATVWLVPPANLGFAGGFRFGTEARPDADCYLLLNNDVQLTEHTIAGCLELIGQDGIGVVGPTLVNSAGIHPQPTALTPLFGVPRRRRRPSSGVDDVGWVTGAIMFVKADCHRQVPMDTRFFLVYEEVDFCVRARTAGWRVVVSPRQAWHTGGGTIPSNSYTYYTIRNRLWFTRIHGRRPQRVAVGLWLALAVLPRAAGSDVLRGRGLARCRFAWHGLVDGIRPLPAMDHPLADEPRPDRWERRVGRPRPGRERPGRERPGRRPTTPPASPARGTDVTAGPSQSPHPGAQMTGRLMAAGLGRDIRRIAAVAGPQAAARFALAAAGAAPAVARTRRLDPVDRAMAGRTWTFQPLPGVRVRLPGSAFSGAREMYCRGVYFARPGYAPGRGESVVDLGANQGLFSVLAAAAGAARVLAVEAQRGFAPVLAEHARANRCEDRITQVHALVGGGTGLLADPSARPVSSHWDGAVPTVAMADLLDTAGLHHVDLMKIDIEGSEFALFDEPGWLDRVGRIVMEVHPEHGDPNTLLRILTGHGFVATLIDNALAPTPTLGDATSGYLYARRRVTELPRPRIEHGSTDRTGHADHSGPPDHSDHAGPPDHADQVDPAGHDGQPGQARARADRAGR
jgi:hypothetical protein